MQEAWGVGCCSPSRTTHFGQAWFAFKEPHIHYVLNAKAGVTEKKAVPGTYNPSTQGLKQEYCKFQASLGYTGKPCFQDNKY